MILRALGGRINISGLWSFDKPSGTAGSQLRRARQTTVQKMVQAISDGTAPHHERHEAAVAPLAPLLLVARPHDLDAADRTKPPKLLEQDLLVHVWCQITHVPTCHVTGHNRTDLHYSTTWLLPHMIICAGVRTAAVHSSCPSAPKLHTPRGGTRLHGPVPLKRHICVRAAHAVDVLAQASPGLHLNPPTPHKLPRTSSTSPALGGTP